MRTNYLMGLLLLLFLGLSILSGCEKQELEVDTLSDTGVSNENINNRTFEAEEWFRKFLLDAYGEETRNNGRIARNL